MSAAAKIWATVILIVLLALMFLLIGAGLDFDISNGFRLVGEAIFRSAEFDSDAGFDESFDTTGVTFNIGLRYRL